MTDAVKAIYTFLSGFGVPVYQEDSVPEDAVFPYMTYNPTITNWDSSALMQVRVWDFPGPDFSAVRLYGIVDQISSATEAGTILKYGPFQYITIVQGDPWAQPQPTPDIKARVVILNFEITTF